MDEKEEKKPTKVNSLRREMSNFGGARSMIRQTKMGGNVIGSGVRVLSEATKKTMDPARFETFDSAMDRLDISIEELPIIHNQLVVQIYLTSFMACLAFISTLNLFVQGVYMGGLVALMVGAAAFTKIIQSSMQCYFIRERHLGISRQWWSKSENWFPKRIDGLVEMAANDPLREPRIVNAMARNARRHFKFGLIVFLPGAISYAVFHSLGWPLVSLTASLVFCLLGASLSFEVYKRRQGVICDLYPWLSTPKAWIPSAPPVVPAFSSKSSARAPVVDSVVDMPVDGVVSAADSTFVNAANEPDGALTTSQSLPGASK